MTARTATRAALGSAAVLSEAEACELLPCRDGDARAWLREAGLVVEHPVLGRVVVWEDVVAAIRARPEPEGPVRPPSGLPRRTLRGQRRKG
jgi:hypothetical protein